jgi:hypothetical protein
LISKEALRRTSWLLPMTVSIFASSVRSGTVLRNSSGLRTWAIKPRRSKDLPRTVTTEAPRSRFSVSAMLSPLWSVSRSILALTMP